LNARLQAVLDTLKAVRPPGGFRMFVPVRDNPRPPNVIELTGLLSLG
jgi:hypothetical protein